MCTWYSFATNITHAERHWAALQFFFMPNIFYCVDKIYRDIGVNQKSYNEQNYIRNGKKPLKDPWSEKNANWKLNLASKSMFQFRVDVGFFANVLHELIDTASRGNWINRIGSFWISFSISCCQTQMLVSLL